MGVGIMLVGAGQLGLRGLAGECMRIPPGGPWLAPLLCDGGPSHSTLEFAGRA
jgi:hypothetical protein